jgi:DNA polymerase V
MFPTALPCRHWTAAMPFNYSAPPAAPTAEAGFPSPAQDFTEGALDLNRLVIRRPAATYFWRVSGSSMTEAGISDGDLLVVDKSITPREDDIVVAIVDGGFALKRLAKAGSGWALRSEGNGVCPTIKVDEETGIVIWGVVTYSFKEHCRR